ncbi:proline iminopeptidase [Oceanobacillus limi]|uniref:Proline iminopeptidase n=1 Tax=Oceanobacillus limi TaxID=930131 RepID=A0A1H9Y4B7_9BACI|nr:alpha/beta hydrolase [Oceanobacillus limi]SES63672.1 proline iminopeptidase [Oceanobacillus limi]
MWKSEIVETSRGKFEIFIKGEGDPICITHLYSEFNELGSYFADEFTNYFNVILVNLREAGNSCKAEDDNLLSMEETVYDLEAIREALGYEKWAFGGHSTGGMLGLKYGLIAQSSLTKIIVGGAAASNKYMEHPESMYCPKSPLNKRVLEILDILKTSNNKEERVSASIEWSNMSLYYPEKRDEYFKDPSSGRTVAKRLDYYSYRELPTYNLVNQLSNVKVPVFVYCGVHDAQCPLVFSEEINTNLHNSVLYKFHSSNHSPFIEEKNKFNKMIVNFKAVQTDELLELGRSK